jgi:hypothetical protein
VICPTFAELLPYNAVVKIMGDVAMMAEDCSPSCPLVKQRCRKRSASSGLFETARFVQVL